MHFIHYFEHLARLVRALEDLFVHHSEQIPVLSKLILEGPIYEDKQLCDDVASLYALGREHGVSVELKNMRLDDPYRWADEPLEVVLKEYIKEWSLDRGVDGLKRVIKDE